MFVYKMIDIFNIVRYHEYICNLQSWLKLGRENFSISALLTQRSVTIYRKDETKIRNHTCGDNSFFCGIRASIGSPSYKQHGISWRNPFLDSVYNSLRKKCSEVHL